MLKNVGKCKMCLLHVSSATKYIILSVTLWFNFNKRSPTIMRFCKQ